MIPAEREALIRHLHWTSTAIGALAVAMGVMVLAGWALGNDLLKGAWTNAITIKSNTAVCLACLGFALILLRGPSPHPVAAWIARGLAAIATVIGAATLSEHLFGWDLGIDQMLFVEAPGSPSTTAPNRMGVPSSTSFVLLGTALLLLDRRAATGGAARFQAFAMAAGLIASIPILGFVFQARELFGIARFTGIAMPTAVTLCLLAIGVLCARPTAGVMRQFIAVDPGGLLIRRLSLSAIALPVLLMWLVAAGERAGLYGTEFGRSLSAMAAIVVFTALVWWTGGTVSRQTRSRLRAEAAEAEARRRLVENLEAMVTARTADLQATNEQLTDFSSSVAHDLRAPIRAVRGYLDALVDEVGALPPEAEGYAERIREATERMDRLIVDLLDYGRLGRVDLHSEPVVLRELVDEVLKQMHSEIHARSAQIDREVGPELAVMAHRPVLVQVVVNLVGNAMKFVEPGVVPRLRVSAEPLVDRVRLSVDDNGIGIAREHHARIFNLFEQLHGREHFAGTGIGLAMVKKSIERMGGEVGVESAPGRGSTFWIELPVATTTPDPAPAGERAAAS